MKLTPKQKTYMYIAIGLVAVVGGYLLLKPKIDGSGTGVDPTGNGTNDPGDTVSNFNAKKTAELLLSAMDQWGTEESIIVAALRSVSQAQFAQVIEAFGVVGYNDNTGNSTGIGLKKRDLPYWLRAELSEEDYALWKQKYPTYL